MVPPARTTSVLPPAARGMMPLLVTIFVALSLAGFLSAFPQRYSDFRAFYCSGRVVLAGADPYREEPLHACEHSLASRFLSPLPAEVTIPAPYPGYVLALFSTVARLPFDSAVIAWTIASCLALAAAGVMIARSTATPLPAVAAVMGFPAAIVALPLGQPTIFVLCAIAACAVLLRARRPRLAALAAVATALDPHVGLAVCAGLFVAVAEARVVLVAAGIGVLAASAIASGPAREWEYLHDVLPLHALVNVPEYSQFSIANLAFTAGIAPKLAVLLGNAWYALSVVAGVIAGVRLRARLGIAAVAFVPVAFAVFGGAHTHLQQLALAIPAFLLVTSAATGMRRRILIIATFAAAMPWLVAAPFPALYLATAVLGIAFAQSVEPARSGLALGAGSFVVLLVLFVAVAHANAPAIPVATPSSGNPLAEIAWGSFVHATSLPAQPWYLAAKLPTLAGFIAMLAAVLDAARTAPPRSPLPA
jgi:hypothetical protein